MHKVKGYRHTDRHVQSNMPLLFQRGHKYLGGTKLQTEGQTDGQSDYMYLMPPVDLSGLGITRGAKVTGCAPVISFSCKGLFISIKTKSNAGGKMIRDMGKKCKSFDHFQGAK